MASPEPGTQFSTKRRHHLRGRQTNRPFTRDRIIDAALSVTVYLLVQLSLTVFLGIRATQHGSSLSDRLRAWDSVWFLRIAEYGYTGGRPIDGNPPEYRTVAFFPASAWFFRSMHAVTGLDYLLAAVIGNVVLGCLCSWLLLRVIRHYSESYLISILGTALFAGFPMSVTYVMAYSEILFAFAALLFILGYLKQNWLMAGAGIFLACLTRMTGFDLAIAFAILVALQHRKSLRAWAAVVLSPLGGLSYLIWANRVSQGAGGYFALQQSVWGTGFDWGKCTREKLPDLLLEPQSLAQLGSGLAMLGIVLLIILAAIARIPLVFWLPATGIAGNILLSSGYYHSRPRLLILSGLLVTVPLVAKLTKKHPVFAGVITVMVVLFGIYFSTFMLTEWRYAI